MNLSPHFSLAELTASTTATARGIDNTLPADLMANAENTAEMMERIRAHLSKIAGRDVPIKITSGYRCTALNAAVGGKANSDHARAQAVDFCAPAFGTPYEICKELAPQISALEVGQLIHEFGTWVHVSTRVPDRPANRVITISAAGTSLGVQRV